MSLKGARGSFLWLCLILSALALVGLSVPADASDVYRKKEIIDARFGKGELKKLLDQAYGLQEMIGQSVVGQERAARALQDRVIQYLEGYGTRDKEPVALHLIGLPGVGKSSILDVLEKAGFKVFRVDAQQFTSPKPELYSLASELRTLGDSGTPAIVLFDELDKIAELHSTDGSQRGEQTHPLIGLLNQILTDGKAQTESVDINLSNVLVMSAMNFSPEEIEGFSDKVLGNRKSFYEFTIEDFARFDEWVRKTPNARAQVLSRLFRSNTVSRLAPNTVIVKPLTEADYRRIAEIQAKKAIDRAMSRQPETRSSFTFSDAFVDFLARNTVYAPSGARDTIVKAKALTEQLISFALKASPAGDESLGQPRAIHFGWDEAAGRVEVTVTPRVQYRGEVRDGKEFTFAVEFDSEDRTFLRPDIVVHEAPAFEHQAPAEKPLTKKEIREARFPKAAAEVKDLAKKLNEVILGQEDYTKHLENELGAYLARKGPAHKAPPFTVFAGFPGIGKSELVSLTGKFLNLPIVRVNLQNFSSDDPGSVKNLIEDLQSQISEVRGNRPDGKFIVQIEELDKIFEIDPRTGALRNRPAMTVIKDLLNDGKVAGHFQTAFGHGSPYEVDIRNAYTVVTMNFGTDLFGFKADPRLTSIDHVLAAWAQLSTRLADLKTVLGTMFLPETVNRLMPYMKILKPLAADSYLKIIELNAAQATRERLLDPATGKNRAGIEVSMTPAYLEYLFSECVIPSEGARYTAVSVRMRVATDLEQALKSIPKNSRIAGENLKIVLDFEPKGSMVRTGAIVVSDPKQEFIELGKRPIALAFPPMTMDGPLPEFRVLVAVHEFGHAFTGVRLGSRFEYATVVPPSNDVGGYVLFNGGVMEARNMLAGLYSTLGSRAMERIFYSNDPLSNKSVMDITAGASGDIMSATEKLWGLLYEFGFDPNGGTIERKGQEGPSRYAHFSDISPEKVEELGLILREMEDHLVRDLLAAHDKEWYREKIIHFARAGGLKEHEFYKMLGYQFPGFNDIPVGGQTRLQKEFEGDIEKPPAEALQAMSSKQGNTQTTAEQNLDLATKVFLESVKKHLHKDNKPVARKRVPKVSCEALFFAGLK